MYALFPFRKTAILTDLIVNPTSFPASTHEQAFMNKNRIFHRQTVSLFFLALVHVLRELEAESKVAVRRPRTTGPKFRPMHFTTTCRCHFAFIPDHMHIVTITSFPRLLESKA